MTKPSRPMNPRRELFHLFQAALRAVDPAARVRDALAEPGIQQALRRAGRVGIFAVGKAAAGMLRGVTGAFERALVVLPRGYEAPPPDPRLEVLAAAHPKPDLSSERAARRALAFFESFDRDDRILCLVSGGASSLLCLPARGVTLTEKRARVALLARSGASIADLNRLRTALSRVKGGRLGRATRARLVTLVLSDVRGDRPALVGSGPTIRGRREDLVRVIGTNRTGLEGAARRAEALGFVPVVRRPYLAGDAREAGSRLGRAACLLAPGEVLLAGGETTVALGAVRGRGGRCLELALGAASAIEGSRVVLLAAASDGRDGSSGAAGAWVDGSTIARARGLGLDPSETLRLHDTDRFFSALRDLLVTGPTGTNVTDWVFAVRIPEPEGSMLEGESIEGSGEGTGRLRL